MNTNIFNVKMRIFLFHRDILSHKQPFGSHLSYQIKMSPLPTRVIKPDLSMSTTLWYSNLLNSLIAIIHTLVVNVKKWKITYPNLCPNTSNTLNVSWKVPATPMNWAWQYIYFWEIFKLAVLSNKTDIKATYSERSIQNGPFP